MKMQALRTFKMAQDTVSYARKPESSQTMQSKPQTSQDQTKCSPLIWLQSVFPIFLEQLVKKNLPHDQTFKTK